MSFEKPSESIKQKINIDSRKKEESELERDKKDIERVGLKIDLKILREKRDVLEEQINEVQRNWNEFMIDIEKRKKKSQETFNEYLNSLESENEKITAQNKYAGSSPLTPIVNEQRIYYDLRINSLNEMLQELDRGIANTEERLKELE